MVEVFTTSFPKSGSTWLWRSLSDLLCAPMQEMLGAPMQTGFAREIRNDYIIRKTHWFREQYSAKGLEGGFSLVVWIYRDPRDMVVSTMYYRDLPDLESSIAFVAKAKYAQYIEGWLSNPPDYLLSYEDMHRRPQAVLTGIYKLVTGRLPLTGDIEQVVQRQKFHSWQYMDKKLLRNGKVGGWKNHFDRTAGRLFENNFGDQLRALDYETGRDWWENLPERFG